jgi:hypothetical protein
MPQGDRTGPNGAGPMTGRAMGFCAGFNSPGFMNSGFGRGLGRGRGFAWRARAIQPMPAQQIQPHVITEKQEKEMLEADLKDLKEEVREIEKRLKEIKD